jgi:oligoribonuclease (3'-5' exoribonuclease)
MSDDLVQSEGRGFTNSELLREFPQVSRTLLYDIITVSQTYHKFYSRLVPKILTGARKTQRMASASTFLEQ